MFKRVLNAFHIKNRGYVLESESITGVPPIKFEFLCPAMNIHTRVFNKLSLFSQICINETALGNTINKGGNVRRDSTVISSFVLRCVHLLLLRLLQGTDGTVTTAAFFKPTAIDAYMPAANYRYAFHYGTSRFSLVFPS